MDDYFLSEGEKTLIKQRRETNKVRYDELTIRQNLLLSIYPNLEEAPKSIKKELEEIISIKLYLKNGVTTSYHGPEMIDGVYIDRFEKEKYESAIKELQELQKENEKYITKHQEAEFKMPTYSIDEYLEQIRNAGDKPGESVIPSKKIREILWLCTYDQSEEFERKRRDATHEWSMKMKRQAEERRKQEKQEHEQRKQAIKEATERYEKLSIFGKIKANITGQGLSHIYDLSTDEINSMYRGRRNKRQSIKTTREIAAEKLDVPSLEEMPELKIEPEQTVQDEQSAKEQWRNNPSQQTYYDYKNEIQNSLEEKQVEPSTEQSAIEEYKATKEEFDEISETPHTLQQEEIDPKLEELKAKEEKIRRSHFTDDKKEELIAELYEEFEKDTEQEPEKTGRHFS